MDMNKTINDFVHTQILGTQFLLTHKLQHPNILLRCIILDQIFPHNFKFQLFSCLESVDQYWASMFDFEPGVWKAWDEKM